MWKKKQAFTMVELLTIMAILSILCMFLVPGLQRSLEQARQTVCVNNQMQIGTVAHLYSSDNYGFLFPMWRGASAALYPTWQSTICTTYLGSSAVCYACPAPRKANALPAPHYGYNWFWLGNRSGKPGFVRRSEILYPQATIVFGDAYGDAGGYNSNGIYPTTYTNLVIAVDMGVSQGMLDDRHRGDTCIIYWDLHCEVLPWYQANRVRWRAY